MNKFFAILIMCSLSLPVLAIEEQEVGVEPQSNAIEETAPEETILPASMQDIGSTYKQPTSKKKLAKKFIMAMLGVAGASIFLYGSLNIYNKLRNTLFSQDVEISGTEKQLDTPTDLTEAIKTFIDKTRWEG